MGTKAACEFFDSWKRINSFFNWVLGMAGHMDQFGETAHRALLDTAHSDEEREELSKHWDNRVSQMEILKKHRQFFLEVVLVRHVENFLNYLSSLLYEIFTQRSETLRSSDKVELSRVLSHDTIESLVRDVAERKVESLSYSAFNELADFFTERFGLNIVPGDKRQYIVEAIEIRNISVHNRCVIDRRFIARTGCATNELGKRKELYIGHIDELVLLFAEQTRRLDAAARKKLKLKGIRFSSANDEDG